MASDIKHVNKEIFCWCWSRRIISLFSRWLRWSLKEKFKYTYFLPKEPVRRSNETILCEPYLNLERQCLSSVERYDPDADEWTKVADMTTRRSGAGVGVIDGLLYAVGGHDGPTVRKSAEVFHPQVRFI